MSKLSSFKEIEAYNAAHNITTSQNPGSSNNNNTGAIPKTYAEKAKDKADKKEKDEKEFNEAIKKLKKHSRPAADYKTYDEYNLHHQVLKRATDPAHGHQFYSNPALNKYIYQDYEDQGVINDIREKLKYIVKDHARRVKLKTFSQKDWEDAAREFKATGEHMTLILIKNWLRNHAKMSATAVSNLQFAAIFPPLRSDPDPYPRCMEVVFSSQEFFDILTLNAKQCSTTETPMLNTFQCTVGTKSLA